MIKRILIQQGYTIPAKYLELDNCEVICDKCKGSGKIVMVYSQFENTKMNCMDCSGDGKRLKCTNCGILCNHEKLHHKDRPDLDTLCFNCVKAKLGLEKNA